jgi:hypothetical protein
MAMLTDGHVALVLLAVDILQLLASVCFLVGSIFFHPALTALSLAAVWLFVGGSFGFLVVSLAYSYQNVRSCLPVSRVHNTGDDHSHISTWFFISTAAQIFASMMFVAGSFAFLPSAGSAGTNAGLWLFLLGSAIFLFPEIYTLGGVYYDHQKVAPHGALAKMLQEDYLLVFTSVNVMLGCWGFIVGCIFYLASDALDHAGAWSFIVGSCAFVMAACLNVGKRVASVVKYYRYPERRAAAAAAAVTADLQHHPHKHEGRRMSAPSALSHAV